MENMEKNEIITTEAIEDITEADSTNGNTLKTVGIIGIGLAGAALLTKFVLLPLGRKAIGAIQRRKAAKKTKTTEQDEVDFEDMNLDEIPEIDE